MKRAILVIVLIIAVPVLAQNQPTAQEATAANRLTQIRFNDPSLRSIFSFAAPQISFVLNEKQKVGKLQLGRTSGENSYAVALAGPINDDGETVLATAEGINNGVNVEFSYKRAFLTDDTPPFTAVELQALCDRFFVPSAEAGVCTLNNMKRTVETIGSEGLRRELMEAIDAGGWGAKWYLGISGKVGRKKFQYADATTLKDSDIVRSGHSFAIGAAVIPDFGPKLYGAALTLRREDAYKSANAVQICVPTSIPPAETCKSRPFGVPLNAEKTLIELETRHYIGMAIAVAPRVTWADADDDQVWGIEVPVYIRTSPADPFQGGLAVNWDSKEKDFSVSVFVGALASFR